MYSVVCMCILEDSPGEVFVCGGNVIFAYLHENGNVIFVHFLQHCMIVTFHLPGIGVLHLSLNYIV